MLNVSEILRSKISSLILLTMLLWCGVTQAFTVKGMVYDEDGVRPLTERVDFTFTIYDSTKQCVLYQEQQNNVNLATYQGGFKLSVGVAPGGARRVRGVDPNLSFFQIFSTSGSSVLSPSGGCPGYRPEPGYRYVRIQFKRKSSGEEITLSPDLPLNPYTRSIVLNTAQAEAVVSSSGFANSGLPPSPSPLPSISPLPKYYIENTGKLNSTNLVRLTNGSDAGFLHHHDSLYLKKASSGSAVNLGSGGATTTSSIGIGTTEAPAGVQLLVRTNSDAIGEIIQGSPSQLADLFRAVNSNGTILMSVDAQGKFYFGSTQTANSEACTKGYINSLTVSELSVSDSVIQWDPALTRVFPANKVACSTSHAVLRSGSSGEISCSALTQADIPNLSWSKITDRPTTLSGYGITDALSTVSSNLVGSPTAPTAPADSDTTQIATTAFVFGQVSTSQPKMDDTASAGSSTRFSRADHLHSSDTTRLAAQNPSFSGDVHLPGAGIWSSDGKVGVGTTSPIAKLEIQGQMRILPYEAGEPSSHALTINWNNGNNQVTGGDCSGPTTYTFQNLLEGSVYFLTMNGLGGGTCIFTDGTNTFKFPKTGSIVSSGRKAVFSFLRAGSTVFVSWDQY